MARRPRISVGGIAYPVMNRTWGCIELFEDPGDYEAFERVLAEAVNEPQDEKELAAIRRSRDRGVPFGDDAWTAKALGLESTLRPPSRPKKKYEAKLQWKYMRSKELKRCQDDYLDSAGWAGGRDPVQL